MIGYIISLIPFMAIFLIFNFSFYGYIYNHQLIQQYSGKQLTRNQINALINNLNNTYKLSLLPIDEYHDTSEYDSKLIFIDQISRVKHFIIGIMFTLTISMSLQLIMLMMCELLNLFTENFRLGLFTFTINCLMLLISFIIPFLVINLFVNQDLFPHPKENYGKSFVSFILLMLWFLVLHKCGDLSRSFQPSYSHHYNTKSFIEKKINEISIAGITILAVLSGIGSTSTPYKLFFDLYQAKKGEKLITESDLFNSIQSYNHTNLLLLKRKSQLNTYISENSGTIYNSPEESVSSENLQNLKSSKNKLGGIFHKVQSFASLSSLSLSNDPQELQYKQEIKSLKSLRSNLLNDLSANLTKFQYQKHSLENENKLLIKIIKIFNISFAVYCIYRIINVLLIKLPLSFYKNDTTPSIINEHDATNDHNHNEVTRDALAVTFAKLLLSIFPNIPITSEMLINQISFILSAGLFFCSFSNVLLTFNQFGKYLPTAQTSNVIKNWIKHLVIGELVGIYVVATAILIRTNLPLTLSQQISKILSLSGTTNSTPQTALREIEFIDNWFDEIFAISSIITLIVIVVKKKIDDEDQDYDEETMLENHYKNY